MRNKTEFPDEIQGNLELDDQGDYNIQVWACSQLGYTNLRWEYSVSPSDANIGGMTTILLRHFHHQKYEQSREHQGNLEWDDQRDNKVQVWAGIQLRYTNLEMEALGLTIICEHWSNDHDSSMPTFILKNRNNPENTKEISNGMTSMWTTKYKSELAFRSGVLI